VFEPQGLHSRAAFFESAVMYSPWPHVDCTEQVLAPAAEYSSAPHSAFLLLVHL
jgi:hypothetical protein